ncbi:hypothetical protein INE39_004588, partial [Escherichia coli]|nr:hypothetical protein [Escherichia coli]
MRKLLSATGAELTNGVTLPSGWLVSGMSKGANNPENLRAFAVCMRQWQHKNSRINF